jgi:hypothetical protein
MNDVGYSFDNDYFRSPDAEVYYAMVRSRQPRTIVEVGCGHSTRVARQAIVDGSLPTTLICVDPDPRCDVEQVADRVYRTRVENVDELFRGLHAGDILFIDSSHRIEPGNDVEHLFGRILPSLVDGVIVHVHDIFLPYQYPRDWIIRNRWGFNEQLLVQVLFTGGNQFLPLWPGHYWYRTRPEVRALFPAAGRPPQSLWMMKGAPQSPIISEA